MSDQNRTSEQNRDRPRWRRIALPISIILNLFFIAVIGGHLWHVHLVLRLREASPMARALANAKAILPAADAAAFGAAFERDAPRYAEAAREMAAARRAVEQKITTEPFDRNAVQQGLMAWRTAWNHFFDEFSGALIDALADISPQGRRKLIAEREARARGEMP